VLAVVAAAGTRLGLATGVNTADAKSNAGTIGIVGAAILVAILLLAYYAGGYVAGRMARFDGGRQGFRVWLLGLLVTIAAAVAGWIGGSQYNVFEQLNLPRIPVDEGDITTGAIITLAVVLVGTLLAAVAGGKAGDRYHRRVDETAWATDR
jgi:MFS family permease